MAFRFQERLGFPLKGRPFAERPFPVRALLILIVVLILIPVSVIGVLGSESVNRWAFAKIDEGLANLELDFERGTLWRGWHFGRIVWKSDTLDVRVDRLEMDWSLSCLLSRRLCVDRLYSHNITVIATPDAEVDPQPLTLPDLRLPLGLQMGDVQVDEISLDGETVLLSELTLKTDSPYVALGSDKGRVYIREFSGRGADVSWHLQGDIRTQGDWPLHMTGQVQLPAVDERDWSLDIEVGGSVELLVLDVASRGYLQGRLTGRVAPLDKGIPASLAWQGDSFLALNSLPESLTLRQWTLSAEGNLDEGFAVRAHSDIRLDAARLDTAQRTPGQSAGERALLELEGVVSPAGAKDVRLLLSMANARDQNLQVTGHFNWQDPWQAEAVLTLDKFPWQRLYPVDTGTINLETLDATVRLQDTQLIADLSATVDGVAGQQVDLLAHVQGDETALRLSPLSVVTDAGSASGEVLLGLASGVEWDGQFELQDLNPGIFIESLPGRLSGQVVSQGRLHDDNLELQGQWNITGELRQAPLAISGRLTKTAESWALMDLLARQGENRVVGQGQWGPKVAGTLELELADLTSLWPGLTGNGHGQVTLSGSANTPGVALQLSGAKLGYNKLLVQRLAVSGNVDFSEAMPGQLKLTAEGVHNDRTVLGNLRVDASGDRAKHQLQLDVTEGLVGGHARLTGNLRDDQWLAQLGDGRILWGEQLWQMEQPASLRYQRAAGELQLGSHCWLQAAARLCFNNTQTLLPGRHINAQLSHFDLKSLSQGHSAQWLPEGVSWDALVNATLLMEQKAGAQPEAEIHVTSSEGVLRVKEAGRAHNFPYQLMDFSARLKAQQAQARLQVSSDVIGVLDINATISDPGGEQVVSGNYLVDHFKLDFLQAFLPAKTRFEGELNGQGSISGRLLDPVVEGQLNLTDGHLSGPNLPVSMDTLSATLAIAGDSAQVDGQWTSGTAGVGRIKGQLGWAPWELELTIQGDALPATYPPYAQLMINPDLSLTLQDNKLRIAGSLAVPEGDITVRELQPEAVQISPDTVIVGQESANQTPSLGITARVKLIVGDQVYLSAFGLSGRLKGQLDVRENMTANGDLRILGGRFKRFGQDLKLRRAILLFSGPITKPYLNVEAVREVDEVVAGLRLTGSALNPVSEVFSEPSMSQQQALSYLVLGRPLSQGDGDSGEDSNLMGQAALALGVAGSAPITKKIAASLGLKHFELETEGVGDETQVVASGNITDKLSLRYGVGVFEPTNLIAVRYEISRRLYIEAISGFASSLDFFYRVDF
ncbi:translocation/assembly module TamB [Aestuariicella hydrocarbonica]|uniref:Translocation/assembly module TamB n=1 Tax=Pseudomaricurvus hydrocarbonicus TaxID=1470433 RepID=A0A9E5JYE6_9GAMM|nr:translocation/assembly module TamB domain-containing protein [Aestuariicella hydrocarbonica]NHO66960.1 translocation/assembly module TamB [Aestuariicella hydrocarbonica]